MINGIVSKDKSNITVVVGMSGGVDSSVAAYLLKKQGYNVIGITMNIWQKEGIENEGGCCGLSAVDDARRVAEHIGIPYYVMDFRKDFEKYVIDNFTNEYLCGRTPNPCIVCNRYVKWEALLHRSVEIGADFIATGHYARIDRIDGRYAIRNSVTALKDQTYALYLLTQEQLARTILPIGDYTKDEIRNIAKEAGLPVANKADSQEICFVPDDDYAGFIEKRVPEKIPGRGNFVDKEGNILGRHKGITHYTIGQRRGLEIAAGHRVFVTEIRPKTNEVVIGENEDIFTTNVRCINPNWMLISELRKGERIRVKAKIRYNHAGEMGWISSLEDGSVVCEFDNAVRAATSGQAIVFYDGEYVLGGGTILV